MIMHKVLYPRYVIDLMYQEKKEEVDNSMEDCTDASI